MVLRCKVDYEGDQEDGLSTEEQSPISLTLFSGKLGLTMEKAKSHLGSWVIRVQSRK